MNAVTSRRLLLLAGTALITSEARAVDEYQDWDRPLDWTRNFRIGMSLGLNIKAKFTTTGSYQITSNPSGDNGFTFDNGYVLKDVSGSTDGQTWNWGYLKSDQFNAEEGALHFQSTSSYDIQGVNSRTASDNPYLGFDLAYGWAVARWGQAKVGVEFGLGIMPIVISDNRNMLATLHGTDYSVQVPGGVILPEGPYNGSFQGPGATISSQATPASEPSTIDGEISGSRTLDVTLYNLRLGPTLFWELSPRVGVGVSAGGAFGVVSGDYKFAERPAGSQGAFATGKFGQTDVVFGGYASGIATYRIEDHGDLYLGLQFMSMTDSTFRQGGREGKLGLGAAFYITAGVNWPF